MPYSGAGYDSGRRGPFCLHSELRKKRIRSNYIICLKWCLCGFVGKANSDYLNVKINSWHLKWFSSYLKILIRRFKISVFSAPQVCGGCSNLLQTWIEIVCHSAAWLLQCSAKVFSHPSLLYMFIWESRKQVEQFIEISANMYRNI